jgi:phosphatidylserine/phosphatidylglycerophosphate/cardiolipin synthase-like enzyme
MKILRTDEAFRQSIVKILRSKPKYFYLSTFNISINDEVKEMLELMKDIKNVKILIGLSNPSDQLCGFLHAIFGKYGIKIRLVKDFHMKSIVSDKKAIIGGRNLTKSGWTDLSFELISKPNILSLKK